MSKTKTKRKSDEAGLKSPPQKKMAFQGEAFDSEDSAVPIPLLKRRVSFQDEQQAAPEDKQVAFDLKQEVQNKANLGKSCLKKPQQKGELLPPAPPSPLASVLLLDDQRTPPPSIAKPTLPRAWCLDAAGERRQRMEDREEREKASAEDSPNRLPDSPVADGLSEVSTQSESAPLSLPEAVHKPRPEAVHKPSAVAKPIAMSIRRSLFQNNGAALGS